MKILNFGSSNIDLVYKVEHITRPGETLAADLLQIHPGGKGLNQSIAIAKAGAKVYHAGCIGEDGQWLRTMMSESGINLCYLKTVSEKTGHAVIQVDANAENCIIIYHGANYCVTKEQIDQVLEDFDPGDILLTQNEISHLPYLLEQAYKKGMHTVFNPSPYHPELQSLPLQQVRWLILNETEATGFFNTVEACIIQKYLQQNCPELRIVLTLGKKGSVYLDSGKILSQPAYQVNCLDTTAAGDTFTGYFIAQITAGSTPETALRIAAAASAIAVSRMGASSSIPMYDEVQEAIFHLQPYPSAQEDSQKAIALQFFREEYPSATVQMLAERLGYSKAYTSTWLTEIFGMTFTELLQQMRLEISAQLLAEGKLSVSEIIHRVGYSNESHFRNIFRNKYGCTPLKYRKIKKG